MWAFNEHVNIDLCTYVAKVNEEYLQWETWILTFTINAYCFYTHPVKPVENSADSEMKSPIDAFKGAGGFMKPCKS